MILLFVFLLAAVQEIGLQQPLELKAYLEAPTPWFPNQEGKILYQIRYQGKIQLTVEDLPMLEPGKGFEKVGDKVIEDYNELNYSVQNIYQKVRPTQSGSFVFPPSHVEGFLYQIQGGNIVPYQTLKSDLPGYEVEVAAFPKEGQPSTFNGSVGSFQFSLGRIGNGPTQVGDWITLAWTARGKDLSGLQLPNIACLPGIVGFFRLNDLPINISQSEETKTYTFQIAPLVTGISEIPPLSWSLFDPKLGKYTTWKSEPIPLTPTSLRTLPKRTFSSVPLPPLKLPQKKAQELLDKGEIPLALLLLQRDWRNKPWSYALPESIHTLEERAGLPLSPFPLYSLILRALRWLLLPFLFYALWKRSFLLIACAAALALFLLSTWGKEREAIVVTSTLTSEGSNSPFLAGEMVNVHSEHGDSVLISSKRQIGSVPRGNLIDI